MVSSYEKSVKGATKIKAAPPKPKYIEHILGATHLGEAGVAEVFRTLSIQLRETAWTIVIKSLITIHFMVRDGKRDITLAYLSQHRNMLAISAYTDAQSHAMTIRGYAGYLSERAKAYRNTKIDWVNDSESRLEKLTVDKGLLRETECVQAQLQALLKCQVMDDEHDEINITVFRLLVLDLLKIFQAVNLGMINILGTFFNMSKPDAERALEIYTTFVDQTDFVVNYLTVARQFEHLTRVEVPQLKHAPVNLGKQLEDYVKDPDFEIHRRQYIAEQAAKKLGGKSGNGGPGTSSAPGRSPETARFPDIGRPKTAGGAQRAPVQPVAAPALPVIAGMEQNLIDLFDDVPGNQTVQTFQQPQQQQQQPQMTGFPQQQQQMQFQQMQFQQMQFQQQQIPPQPTGLASTNPFQAAGFPAAPAVPQGFAPMQAPMATGAGFGGFTTLAQQQQYQPTGLQVPQGAPQFSQQQFMPPPPVPQQTLQPLVPTATGTNPFRQSMLPSNTGGPNSPRSTNPFARPATGAGPTSPGFPGQTQAPLLPSATGKNPFAKHASLIPSMTGPAPLVAQATGTNPFRQSMMPQNTGWIGGGLDSVPTIPAFPRQQGQQW